ncbi:hypothetical protein [Spirosoma migulaei]
MNLFIIDIAPVADGSDYHPGVRRPGSCRLRGNHRPSNCVAAFAIAKELSEVDRVRAQFAVDGLGEASP